MSLESDLLAYKAQVNNDVSTQVDPNSIPPDAVGSIGTDLADILLPYLLKINLFGIGSGTAIPSGGLENDIYYKSNLNSIGVYRKVAGNWTLLTNIALGISYPDGIISGLRTSIIGNDVTVSPGSWAMANVFYSKLTQTQLTLAAKNLNYGRWDLIYANNANQVNIVTGVASSVPAKPNLPANSILVDYAYVPNVGSPFLLAGQSETTNSSGASKTKIDVTIPIIINWQTDIISNETITYAQKHGNSIAVVQGHYLQEGAMTPYNPEYTFTLNGDGTINTLNLIYVQEGTITII